MTTRFFDQAGDTQRYYRYLSHKGCCILLCLFLLASCSSHTSNQTSSTPSSAQPLPDSENVLPPEQATVVAYPEQQFSDPLIGFNRAIFAFNDVSYRYVMIPIAKMYLKTPEGLQTSVSHFFANLQAPKSFINHLLQGEPKRAGLTLTRFLTNTTIGLLGLFDPAENWFDLSPDTTGFNDTLQQYGVEQGAYIVLPFFGPGDLRSSGGFVLDFSVNPVRYLTEQPETTIITAVDAEQAFSSQAERYEILRSKSEDPYLFFRNMYLQGQLRDEQYQTISNRSDKSRRLASEPSSKPTIQESE